jgi:hypothetical protein
VGIRNYTYPDGSIYEGEWQNNKRHGRGLWFRPDGMKYDGEWKNDKPNGQGTLILPNGKILVGLWQDSKLVEEKQPSEPKLELEVKKERYNHTPRTTEFVLGLIAGILGLFGGVIVVFVETAFSALGDQSDGWYAVLFSVVIILSSVLVKSMPKIAGIGMVVGAVGGLVNVGLFFIIPGILAFIAGLVALIKRG